MRGLKRIIREQLEDKVCDLVTKYLKLVCHYENINGQPTFFLENSDEDGYFNMKYPINTKDDYWDFFYDVEDFIIEKFDFDSEEITDCIEIFIDNKIGDEMMGKIMLDEAEAEAGGDTGGSTGGETASTGDSGGSGSNGDEKTSAKGKEWESGLTRGPSNPITYDTEWAGQRGWEGIKSYSKQRGKANPVW